MFIGIAINLHQKRRGSGASSGGAGDDLLIEGGTDSLLMEDGTSAILLETN